jgi:hypothetical protein
MILQTLNIRNNCEGAFHNGKFVFGEISPIFEEYDTAWKYSRFMDDTKYKFLFLLAKKDDISEFSENPEKYKLLLSRLQAQADAAAIAKINLEEECIFDLLPNFQVQALFEEREIILSNINKNFKKGLDYDILHKAHVLSENISQNIVNWTSGCKNHIKYNIFGSATGRLTNTKDSIPVLTMKKEERTNLLPQNDLYLDLDLNGAEIRTLLALSGEEQPQADIHEWNLTNCARNLTTRKEVKERFFAWLYNPDAEDHMLERVYDKGIYNKYYDDGFITTPFGRRIEVEERKALNYLIQSTTSDIVIENAYKIMKLLEGKKSFIAFTMHDSIVLDFSKEEYSLVRQIKDRFEYNKLGKFLSTLRIGNNFGNMREIKI